MEHEICYKCGGLIKGHLYNSVQTRFTNGNQEYVCTVCGDEINYAVCKSREFYGIDKRAWRIVLKKFKRNNGIPLFGNLNAKQQEMIEGKRKALLRLMFIMDIRAVKKCLQDG